MMPIKHATVTRASKRWLALCLTLTYAAVLHAQPTPLATEATQLINEAHLVEQITRQVKQLEQGLQMVENMVQNTLSIPNLIWSNVEHDLLQLFKIVRQGQALAFSAADIGKRFMEKFPRFSELRGRNYIKDYENWTETVRDSLKTSLEAASLQAAQFADEESTLRQLRELSRKAQGRMQAIQVGNQIAHEAVTQLQKLRGLIMAQIQAQNAFMAGLQAVSDVEEDALRNFLDRPNLPLDDASIKRELEEKGY